MTATELKFESGKSQTYTLEKGKSYSIADGKYDYSISGRNLVITSESGEGEAKVTSKIVLKNYATKDVSDGVMVGEKDLDSLISFVREPRKNSFTGSRFADTAESTVKNETFKLGAGNDSITFDAKAGFGKDTVVLSKGENLTMSIMNGEAKYDAVSYNVKGNDVVVTADKVEYVAEARVSGKVDGVNIRNNVYTFRLEQYKLNENAPATDAQKALVGNYMFKGCEYGSNKTFADGKRALYLDNSDFASTEPIKFDGAEISDIKVYKIVNGVKTDITEEYKNAVKNASNYDYNKDLANKEFEGGSVVLKDFAKKDAGAELTVNGVDLSEYVFSATHKKNSFTGSRLDEKATSTGANETFKLGTGNDTITFGKATDDKGAMVSDGNDTVILSKGEELTLNGLNKDNLTYSRKGNDITITNTIKATGEGAEDVVSTVKVKDYLKGNATVTVGAGDDLTKLLNDSKSGFLTYKVAEGKENRAVKFTGTLLNETFVGSNKNDVINGGAGNDDITGGKGNDKLYGGTGENTFHFTKQSGNDTVYSTGTDKLIFAEGTQTYARKGNDVVITTKYDLATNERLAENGKIYTIVEHKDAEGDNPAVEGTKKVVMGSTLDETHVKVGDKVYDISKAGDGVKTKPETGDYTQVGENWYETSKVTSSDYVEPVRAGKGEIEVDGYIFNVRDGVKPTVDTVTVKDYLKKVGQDVTVGNKDLTEILNGLNFSYGNAKGVEYNKAQKLTGSFLNETFTGGKKADKIYTGAGTDTITAGAGNDTIYVNGDGTKTMTIGMNDGNDTIVMSSKADLKINFTLPEPVQAAAGGEVTEEPSTPKAFECATSYTRKGNDLIINNTYTGGDLTKAKAQTTTIKNYFKYGESSLSVNGSEVKTSMMSYQYTGSTKSNEYDFSEFNYAEVVVTDKKGNDIYNVDAFDKEIVINDKAGRDTLNLGMASKDVALVFNVNANGKASGSLLMGSSVENALNGNSVEIANYFTKAGKIETINTKETEGAEFTSIETRIDTITQAVQGWLADHSDYKDAMAVMNKENNADDIASLMNVYTTGTYTKPETPAVPVNPTV